MTSLHIVVILSPATLNISLPATLPRHVLTMFSYYKILVTHTVTLEWTLRQ